MIHFKTAMIAAVLLAASASYSADSIIHLPKSQWEKYTRSTVKVGDYVEFVTDTHPGLRLRQEVAVVGDHTITMSETTTLDGELGSSDLVILKYDQSDDLPEGVVMKETIENMTVAGKEISTVKITPTMGEKSLSSVWFSKDVPCSGLVKAETKRGMMTLDKFGGLGK